MPGLRKHADELLIGTIAPLRPEKNLGRLLRTFAAVAATSQARLVVVGEGSERERLARTAAELGIAERVVFAGSTDEPERVLGWFDIFAISSDTEQMPNSVLQAMAAGKPILGVDVGDIKRMVAPGNRRFIVPKTEEEQFRDALDVLLMDRSLRDRIGSQNQCHVRAHYGQQRMFDRYEEAIDGCLTGRWHVPTRQREHPAPQ
jgi:glycosyltransferase involved in cell wall biosynthesis